MTFAEIASEAKQQMIPVAAGETQFKVNNCLQLIADMADLLDALVTPVH